jgi:hypothetical protein
VTFQGAALERVFKRTIKLGRFKDEPNIWSRKNGLAFTVYDVQFAKLIT